MSFGGIVTMIIAALVLFGGCVLFVWARRERDEARRSQRHSNVKPTPIVDEEKYASSRLPPNDMA
jgi:hypothetical protein